MTTPTQPSQLRILLVEEDPEFAHVLSQHLRAGLLEPEILSVATEPEFTAFLTEPWDVVLSNYRLSFFSAPEALRILRHAGLPTPFIVVNGDIGEEATADIMRQSANDCILKTNLARLCPAILREIKEARETHNREGYLAERRASLLKFRKAGRALLLELRAHKVCKTEMSLAEHIIELTYYWGRTSVVVPQLEIFAVLIGVRFQHVSTTLLNLQVMKIITIEPTTNGARYTINPNSQEWKVTPTGISRAQVRQAYETLRVFNGVADAPESDPHFFEPIPGGLFFAPPLTETVKPPARLAG